MAAQHGAAYSKLVSRSKIDRRTKLKEALQEAAGKREGSAQDMAEALVNTMSEEEAQAVCGIYIPGGHPPSPLN